MDENWYEFGDLPFDLYEGFPLDTGTLVALRFLNPENTIPVAIVSCHIYAGQEDSLTPGRAMRQAIEESSKRVVVVACTGLSARFFTEDIDPRQDRISHTEDETWNQRMLHLIARGKNTEGLSLSRAYTQAAVADMGFKAFAWLMGVLGTPDTKGKVLAYGPIWGTGAVVVEHALR